MKRKMRCTFKRIYGDKTGAQCRTGPGKMFPPLGFLYMLKCPDGKSFIVDPDDTSDGYYRLIEPTKYGLPDTTTYVLLDNKFLLSREISFEGFQWNPIVEPLTTGMNINLNDPTVKMSSVTDDRMLKNTKSKENATNTGLPSFDNVDNTFEYMNDYTYIDDLLNRYNTGTSIAEKEGVAKAIYAGNFGGAVTGRLKYLKDILTSKEYDDTAKMWAYNRLLRGEYRVDKDHRYNTTNQINYLRKMYFSGNAGNKAWAEQQIKTGSFPAPSNDLLYLKKVLLDPSSSAQQKTWAFQDILDGKFPDALALNANGQEIVESKLNYDSGDELDMQANITGSAWKSGNSVYTTDSIGINKKYGYVNGYNNYNDFTNAYNIIRNNLNISFGSKTLLDVRKNMENKFNRFKIGYPDIQLSKSFAHIFFTRPDLNIFDSQGSGNYTLKPTLHKDPVYYYLNKNNSNLLLSLTSMFSTEHDFNPYLSNSAQSFSLSDEYIKTVETGDTFTGYKVKYGRSNVESQSANTFDINYTDTDDLSIYKLHKAWIEYIHKVHRGEFTCDHKYIQDRVLDYACSVYYILCGPDGETIIFWSKYTGVFPTNAPASAFSWSKGNQLKMPEFTINYEYSWKEDFNPLSLAEFNLNSKSQKQYKYISSYEYELATTGKTFTGAPFVESTMGVDGEYIFKLRFRTP